ncbi:MAG: B12-binding domain-containing radical SAM protein [Candidatus Uhrbacteria bacterium]
MNLDNPIRILLVNPETPKTYWGFQDLMSFVGRKAAHAPLALITVAAIMRKLRPGRFEFKMVDLNIDRLTDKNILWSDFVFVTGMNIERASIARVLNQCCQLERPTVVGGPFVRSQPDAPELALACSLFLGEGESLSAELVRDLESEKLKSEYKSDPGHWADLTSSPVPAYELLKTQAYHSMPIQASRGCPHGCEFCCVRILDGARPRYKTPAQIIQELEAIEQTRFRGNVFFVDDNFIGNIKTAKAILQAMIPKNHPFLFYTQVSTRLAEDDQLMEMMVEAGFFSVFIGLETPCVESLKEVGKNQNLKITPLEACRRPRKKGLLVYSGLVVGFDNDGPEIFEAMRQMVDECSIVMAMVGMLIAFPGTKLYTRLKSEGRIVPGSEDDQFVCTNIAPKMGKIELIRGYRELIEYLYKPKNFLRRAYSSLMEWKPNKNRRERLPWREYLAAPKIIIRQGIFSTYAHHWWVFMLKVLFTCPSKIPRAFAESAYAHHFYHYTKKVVLPRLLAVERSLT